jgi:hypothetical protein
MQTKNPLSSAWGSYAAQKSLKLDLELDLTVESCADQSLLAKSTKGVTKSRIASVHPAPSSAPMGGCREGPHVSCTLGIALELQTVA